ncbi:hypothetical protein [Microvirga sp. VF16]|uniref:hypothetical protein n=1 Tax=Microvirga sp. VF16 TaxID=2807101 RepID=UPI00193D84E3|nr:hypothetical protein [Microvirga sp. VF16]QRM35040.1 hypothetical protein JO965_39250 [Microvirga sp. VF16]
MQKLMMGVLVTAGLVAAADVSAAPAPKVPVYGRDFSEVAVDAVQYRTGVTEKQANRVIKETREAFARCVREKASTPAGNCIVAKDGLVLKYDARTGGISYRVEYGHKSGDGYRPDFTDENGAEQSGNEVRVWAGDKSTTYPVR